MNYTPIIGAVLLLLLIGITLSIFDKQFKENCFRMADQASCNPR